MRSNSCADAMRRITEFEQMRQPRVPSPTMHARCLLAAHELHGHHIYHESMDTNIMKTILISRSPASTSESASALQPNSCNLHPLQGIPQMQPNDEAGIGKLYNYKVAVQAVTYKLQQHNHAQPYIHTVGFEV